MNATEGFRFEGLDADSDPFVVRGGKYVLGVINGTPGAEPVGVAMQMPSGGYVPVVCFTSDATNSQGVTGGNGSAIMDLPPGTYKIDVGDNADVDATLVSVPY